jgi:large subunit ribosomal protein L35
LNWSAGTEENTRIYEMPRNRSKPKLKLKTHRGAAKRFKITATGKLLRMHSGKRHLLGSKAPGRMRKLKKLTKVSKADAAKTMQMLPYGLR